MHDEILSTNPASASEPRGLGGLANVYGLKIYWQARRYVRRAEDAEDVTQDVLMTVAQKLQSFRGESALSSWIYRITFNTSMNWLRTRRRHRSADGADAPPLPEAPASAGDRPKPPLVDRASPPDEYVLRSELRRRLTHALRELPAIYRGPVVLRDVRGLSIGEGSAVLHIKRQTFKSRLHRGRCALRRALADFRRRTVVTSITPARCSLDVLPADELTVTHSCASAVARRTSAR